MAFWLDASLVVLAILFVVIGFYRGVVISLVELAGTLASVVAAVVLASAIAPVIFTAFVRPPLAESIQTSITSTIGQDAAARVQSVMEALPKFISNSLSGYGLTANEFSGALSSAGDRAASAVVDLIAPIVTDLIKTVLMLVLFLILMIFVRLAARGIDKVFRLPVLRQLNAVLGAVFGLLKCALFVMLACAGLRIVLPMLSSSPALFSKETLESTLLFQHIYDSNPIYGLLQFWL